MERTFHINVFHRPSMLKGDGVYRRSFYYSSSNTGDELEEELSRTFRTLGITDVVNYSVIEVAPLVFISDALNMGAY